VQWREQRRGEGDGQSKRCAGWLCHGWVWRQRGWGVRGEGGGSEGCELTRGVVLLMLSLCLIVLFVPQYGCLAAIFPLLALNHCACLRNARRISYENCKLWVISSSEQTTEVLALSSPLPSPHLVPQLLEGLFDDIVCLLHCSILS
jgi:hypothetical protein